MTHNIFILLDIKIKGYFMTQRFLWLGVFNTCSPKKWQLRVDITAVLIDHDMLPIIYPSNSMTFDDTDLLIKTLVNEATAQKTNRKNIYFHHPLKFNIIESGKN